jgi:radical SAM superfamily enzyme YgiQ (UPF0313 family)
MARGSYEVIGKVSNGVVTVTLNGKEMGAFDLEGRVLYYGRGSSTYRRSISNKVYRIEWIGREDRIVERLPDSRPILRRAYEIADEAWHNVTDISLKAALETPASRTVSWLTTDANRVAKLYKPISIVPPDLYFSTYLQLTSGCPWNKCSFCTLYGDRGYSVKSSIEFSNHIQSVKEYLGKGVDARRSIFLGDANSLSVGRKFLKPIFAEIAKEFDNPSVYSFVDAFNTPRNLQESDFRDLRNLGLRRIYLGLESGEEQVLKILNKPMELEEARNFVRQVKKAGVNAGIIILVGAGGKSLWKEHVKRSVTFLKEVDLGREDIVYLSPLVENGTYSDLARKLNLGILSTIEKERQAEEFQEQLKGEIDCPVSRYDIRESFIS